MADGANSGRKVLAIDLGSSSVRAGVADTAGRLLSTERLAPVMRQQTDAGDLAVEFDPEPTWNQIIDVARAAISNSPTGVEKIGAVAVTSQRQGIALLDRDGKTLYAGPNSDMRAVFQSGRLSCDARCGYRQSPSDTGR